MASQVTTRKRNWWRTLAGREAIAGYISISPWLLGFLFFGIAPLIAAAYYSLTNFEILTPPRFIGHDNFVKMFTKDRLFWQSLKVTIIFTLVTVPLGTALGYGMAVLLNQKVRGLSLWRTGFYLPAVVPGLAAAYLFSYVFAHDFGLADSILKTFGINNPPNWYGSTEWALPTLMMLHLWGAGAGLILFLSALQGVPTALYDAGKVDGANAWARFRHITPAHDVPGDPVQSHHWHHRLVPDLYQCLNRHRRRPGQLDPVLCALSLSQGLGAVSDGVCGRPGLGSLHHHPQPDNPCPEDIRALGLLWRRVEREQRCRKLRHKVCPGSKRQE